MTKDIQNGVIINGTLYEFVPGNKDAHECSDCEFVSACFDANDVICRPLFEPTFGVGFVRGKVFKKSGTVYRLK